MRHPAAMVLWVVCGVGLLSGCGRPPSAHFYMLEHERGNSASSSTATERQGLTIGVRSFRVDPPYDQDRLIYRRGESSPEIGFYQYHRWAAPLSRMLPTFVSDELRDARGVRAIEPAVGGRKYAAYLDGRLLAIEEIDTPGNQRVRIGLVLTLELEDGTELWTEALHGQSNTRAASVADVVEQMNSVLRGMLVQARPGLERALARS